MYFLPGTFPGLGIFPHLIPAKAALYKKGAAAIQKRQIKSRNWEQHKYQSIRKTKELESVAKQNSET